MKRHQLYLNTAIVAALTLASTAFLSPPAEARSRGVTITGANGHSASRQVTRQGGNVSSSTTFGNGETMSRTVSRSGTGTTATVTGPNGQSATRSTTFTGNGSNTTLTGPNGQTGSITTTR